MIGLATEEKNDDFSAKQVRLQGRNYRLTSVDCCKTVFVASVLLLEKPWINPCIPQYV